jgi:hypothetical protein
MTVRRGRKPAVQGKSSMPATAMSAGQRSSISENRNAAMAQGDEMAHDRLHGRMIIHHDRVGFDADEFAVDADDRQSVDDHILDDVIVAARWRNDETVDALLREHVEIHALLVAAFLSVAENEIIAADVPMDDVFDAQYEIGEERLAISEIITPIVWVGLRRRLRATPCGLASSTRAWSRPDTKREPLSTWDTVAGLFVVLDPRRVHRPGQSGETAQIAMTTFFMVDELDCFKRNHCLGEHLFCPRISVGLRRYCYAWTYAR